MGWRDSLKNAVSPPRSPDLSQANWIKPRAPSGHIGLVRSPPPPPGQAYAQPQQLPPRGPPAIVRSLRLLSTSVIEAEIVLPGGARVSKKHNLNNDLGNDDGTFAFDGVNFSGSARNVCLRDATLYAELCTRDGRWQYDKVGIAIGLSPLQAVQDITIRVVQYNACHSPSIQDDRTRLIACDSEDLRNLRLISCHVLAAECRQQDGQYATSYVDLNKYIGNSNGHFKRNGDGFSHTGKNIRLVGTTLTGTLAPNNGPRSERTIDVSRIVRVAHGQLLPYKIDRPKQMMRPSPEDVPTDSSNEPLIGCSSISLLDETVLIAKCNLRGGLTQEATFKLVDLFGMVERHIRPFGHHFHVQDPIRKDSIRLDGSILSMEVEQEQGENSNTTFKTETIDLKEFIANKDGELVLREYGPCEGCEKMFRAGRVYSPMRDDKFRTRLDGFNLTDINRKCGICKVVQKIVESSVPFVRSYEVFVETNSEYFGDYLIKSVEIEAIVNGASYRHRLYADSNSHLTSRAFNMMPIREHTDFWFEPEKRWQMVSSRLEECTKTHKGCQRREDPALPTRCLDIGSREDDHIRIVDTQDMNGNYACLSHAWGKSKTCKLTAETFERFTTNIPPDDLPRTYKDAIRICRDLGTRYLWIDSLCIFQDSKDDWLSESSKMITYYGQCFICIASTNLSGPNAGLEIAERPSAIRAKGMDADGVAYSLVAYPSHLIGAVPHFSRADMSTVEQSFPLLTRAWVFQERLLAPRTLHFCGAEVVVECIEGIKCECGHAEEPYLFDIGGDEGRVMSVDNMHDGLVLKRKKHEDMRWTQLVSAYSSLKLTFATDHLPAISGLARDFASRRTEKPLGKYLAGIWLNSIHDELLWFVGEPLLRFREKPLLKTDDSKKQDSLAMSPLARKPRSKKYIAPSWSWSSVFDPVKYRSLDPNQKQLCEVQNAEVVLEGEDEFGRVAEGCYLQISGRLAPTTWSIVNDEQSTQFLLNGITGTQRLDQYEARGTCAFLPDYTITSRGPHQVSPTDEMFVLPVLSRNVGLAQWSYNTKDREKVERELQFVRDIRNTLCLVLRRHELDVYEGLPVYERIGFTEFANVKSSAKNQDPNHYVDETFLFV